MNPGVISRDSSRPSDSRVNSAESVDRSVFYLLGRKFNLERLLTLLFFFFFFFLLLGRIASWLITSDSYRHWVRAIPMPYGRPTRFSRPIYDKKCVIIYSSHRSGWAQYEETVSAEHSVGVVGPWYVPYVLLSCYDNWEDVVRCFAPGKLGNLSCCLLMGVARRT